MIETSLQQSEEGAFYVISVADDGPGVPAVIKGRVFEPFFTTKPVGEGTGLGLAIAYGVIDAHSGNIEVSEARLKGGAGRRALYDDNTGQMDAIRTRNNRKN
ncbi:MAG: ATP-binding protein [Acetobacteraceae bacterium]